MIQAFVVSAPCFLAPMAPARLWLLTTSAQLPHRLIALKMQGAATGILTRKNVTPQPWLHDRQIRTLLVAPKSGRAIARTASKTLRRNPYRE